MDPVRILGTALCVFLASSATALPQGNSSGGVLLPEEAAYDVLHYDLELDVFPNDQTIDGRLELTASLVRPTERIVLDLDRALHVEEVSDERGLLSWERDGDRIWIRSPRFEGDPGSELRLAIKYGGTPRVAPKPPWEGGFTWAETRDGQPWIATSCQGEGADLWWPCKDHPSDEPESMDLHISVPVPLVVASNGRLLSVEDDDSGWLTYHWRVSTPINNYGVALNIAPYETLDAKYESTSGDTFDVTYWVLPENVEAGREFFPQILQHLRFMEELFGPYPFRADKYGVAETPHLGMEHQSIIAYGNKYKDNRWGFDWNDFWINESFGTYAQTL
jgi:aminopeptidase N